jgi:hypothetical protein
MPSSKFKRLAAQSMVVATLLSGATVPYAAVPQVYADDAGTAQETLYEVPSIGTVYITGKSYIEIKDVVMSAGTDSNLVTFTLKLTNGDAGDIPFIDYWVRLISSSDVKHTVKLANPEDEEKNIVPPGTSQEFKFMADVSSTVRLSDLTFRIIEWDFSSPDTNYERALGEVKVPADYSPVVPANAESIVKLAKTSVKTHIKKAAIGSNSENYLPNLLFELENVDTRSVKLPNLQFTLRTADGLLYPLQVSGLSGQAAIDPLMKKEITLSGKLPKAVNPDGWQLIVTETADGGNNSGRAMPVAIYEVPKPAEEQLATEKEQAFYGANGYYLAKLESVQRVPWEDEDLIAVSIVLKPNEDRPLPIPNLTGYLKLDDAVQVYAKVIRMDNVIALQPGKETRIQLLGRIPYTYEYSTLSVHLQEKSSSGGGDPGEVTDLVAFRLDSSLDSVPLVSAGEHYKIGGIGRSGDYTVHAFHRFTGNNTVVLTAQVAVENLEKRPNELSKLVAQFKSSDGTVYPASITEIKSKINPSGKALLFVWANVAKNKSEDITQLIVGEGVKDDQFAQPTDQPDGYVNAVSFVLPKEKTEPQNTIKQIDLFPYTLSLSRVGASVEIGQGIVNISFDYKLEKDSTYETNPNDYKIMIEMEDNNGLATLAKTFSIEAQNQDGGGNGDNQTLLLGEHTMKTSVNDSEFIYKTRFMDKYKLNIYQLFQGQKKLIASKELDWFIYSD